MLNLKRLQYLDAVYQYKNFTQASEALYVSQPALSSAVQALEEELGAAGGPQLQGRYLYIRGRAVYDLGAAHPQHL